MAEVETGQPAPAPRRGLPARPGEGAKKQTPVSERIKAQGVPEVNVLEAGTSPEPETPRAKAERRRGLPRVSGEASEQPGDTRVPSMPQPISSSKAVPRRGGLPRPAASSTQDLASAARVTKPQVAPAPTVRVAGQGAKTTNGAPNSSSGDGPEVLSRRRLLSRRSIRITAAVAVLLAVAGALVLIARWLVGLAPIHDFLATYPGESHLPDVAPVGIPGWLGWQHFFNAFFIVLIIRTGWQVRTQKRPPASWTRNNSGFIKTKNPPKLISLTLWTHLSLDVLWLVNGVIFVVLLVVTGQWMRVVPASWDVFPNALSAALQYASLNWPTEDGWVNYNSLQLLAYFTTIFIAAPLAAITGVRMSGAWPRNAARVNKLYPIEVARAIHLPVMLYFVLFVVAHVTLVFATGALRNLNHMYGGQDAVNWTGFWIFFGSLLVMIAAVLAMRPIVLAPIASLMGKVGR